MVSVPEKSYNYTPLPSPPTLPQSVEDYRQEFKEYPRMLIVNPAQLHAITWTEYTIPVPNNPPALAPLDNTDIEASPRLYWRIRINFDHAIAPGKSVCQGFAESEQ